ncbi:MAG: oligosaccharide flippase family protein [Bacteroidetes bacterium]|nr:oligosaccharide flippase family protein [Bacteroidota bacterium]
MKSTSNYGQIFKATGVFGTVQVISILVMILRAKFVAVTIGPEGMGVYSLLVSTVTLVTIVVSMGLNYSVIRDLSIANERGNITLFDRIAVILKHWVFVSCLLGAIFLIGFSSLLSNLTFGNHEYTIAFACLSGMLIFTILTNTNNALLQGTRKITYTAQSSIIGSLLSLIVSIPIFFIYGVKGIVAALIFSSIITYLVSRFFVNKIRLAAFKVDRGEIFTDGIKMVKLGLIMVGAQLLSNAIMYLTNAFIRKTGSLVDVGLYQAGTMMTTQSIGLVFSAMAMDYFPRLSAVSAKVEEVNKTVNEQGVISVLISVPLLIFMIVFAPFIIRVLLSQDFYILTSFIRWLAFGMFFTAPIFVIGYIALAKGDKKNYFLYNSLYTSIFLFLCNIIGYFVNGLKGMAIGYCIYQVVYAFFIYSQFKKIYSFSFDSLFIKIFFRLVILCAMALLVMVFFQSPFNYIIGTLLSLGAFFYSWRELNRLINFRALFQRNIK